MALNEFEQQWRDPQSRLDLIPGKEALKEVNRYLENSYGVSITSTAIIDSMRLDEVPTEMKELVELLKRFSATLPRSNRPGA